MPIGPFHLAFPVLDVEETKDFYRDVLGCGVGRQTDHWVDLDFHGHQLSAHAVTEMPRLPSSEVDGRAVPVTHFGLVLEEAEWQSVCGRLEEAGANFLIEPYLRFKGQPGEQWTMFVTDPSGNGLEFKAFTQPSAVFV